MSEFIKVTIDLKKCLGIAECGACIRVCPVNIFQKSKNEPRVVEHNQDECTLCDLCLNECTPDAVIIDKLYL